MLNSGTVRPGKIASWVYRSDLRASQISFNYETSLDRTFMKMYFWKGLLCVCVRVWTHTMVFPTCLKAFSTNSLTLWTSPVAMTKSSGSSCCSITHIAWKRQRQTETERLNHWETIKTVQSSTLDTGQFNPDRQEVNLWPLNGAFARTSVMTSPQGLMGRIPWERRTEHSHRPTMLLVHTKSHMWPWIHMHMYMYMQTKQIHRKVTWSNSLKQHHNTDEKLTVKSRTWSRNKIQQHPVLTCVHNFWLSGLGSIIISQYTPVKADSLGSLMDPELY